MLGRLFRSHALAHWVRVIPTCYMGIQWRVTEAKLSKSCLSEAVTKVEEVVELHTQLKSREVVVCLFFLKNLIPSLLVLQR